MAGLQPRAAGPGGSASATCQTGVVGRHGRAGWYGLANQHCTLARKADIVGMVVPNWRQAVSNVWGNYCLSGRPSGHAFLAGMQGRCGVAGFPSRVNQLGHAGRYCTVCLVDRFGRAGGFAMHLRAGLPSLPGLLGQACRPDRARSPGPCGKTCPLDLAIRVGLASGP